MQGVQREVMTRDQRQNLISRNVICDGAVEITPDLVGQ